MAVTYNVYICKNQPLFSKIAQLFIQLLTKSQTLRGYGLSFTILSKWSLTILFDVFLRTLIPHSNVAMATFLDRCLVKLSLYMNTNNECLKTFCLKDIHM